jgi:aminopeptidase
MHGGEGLSDEDFTARGGNFSMAHVDFMIGSDEMDIDGVLPDGRSEPLMRRGNWAFEV